MERTARSVRLAVAVAREHAWFAAVLLVLALAMTESAVAADTAPGKECPAATALSFHYGDTTERSMSELAAVLRESCILELWTGYVGTRLRGIPIRMEIAFAECGNTGSWYDGNHQRIVVCYEEIARIYAILASPGHDETKLLVSWVGSIFAELYHEFGHALIHRLALPVTGREEDATDQFAVLALLHHPHGADLALGDADFLQGMAEAEKEDGTDPSAPHASYSQRYYNMLCWTYGSDPDAHRSLVESGRLPAARAESCRLEYLRASYAWERLLEPFTTE